ncbi:MAG TPA: hydroxyisourate hydrolase [Nocardioides sp.]|nr:hydroxyisourate hydrolase [Nocardioides sp.]
MATLSTHVLDTARGRPAAGLRVELSASDGSAVADGVTDADGRVGSLGGDLQEGSYALRFDTGGYLGADAFYPEVVVTFAVGADDHYHVPLLLSPFGYSTYRGS